MKNTIIIAWKDGRIHYFKKDKSLVDILCEECIMGYTEAAELYSKLPYNITKSVVSLKELILNNKDISHKLIEQFVKDTLTIT